MNIFCKVILAFGVSSIATLSACGTQSQGKMASNALQSGAIGTKKTPPKMPAMSQGQPNSDAIKQRLKFYEEMSKVETVPKPMPLTESGAILASMKSQMQTQYNWWFNQGQFLSAIQALKILQAFYPMDYDLTTNLGWMLENVEKNDEALAVYKKYRLSFPNFPDAAFPEALFDYRNRKYSEAVEILAPLMGKETRPEPNAYRILAHSYQHLKEYQKSLDVWNIYLKLVPDDLEAIHNQKEMAQKVAKSGG